LGSVTSGQLIAQIDRAWDERAAIRARIEQRLPDLQTRAKQTNRLLVDLLRANPLAAGTRLNRPRRRHVL
jgi:hypothetical protein